jgi:hypothetical protein
VAKRVGLQYGVDLVSGILVELVLLRDALLEALVLSFAVPTLQHHCDMGADWCVWESQVQDISFYLLREIMLVM